ncbi:MAG: hypothetical protein A3K59_04785 [Euryarchaeota archaeon RBG_19FT_COMBO_69_17]|nr:MAG: hypothetical protein A3K59_04785 [Euryarchaeota archaeon RBG_19FT_COMBO_69_17]
MKSLRTTCSSTMTRSWRIAFRSRRGLDLISRPPTKRTSNTTYVAGVVLARQSIRIGSPLCSRSRSFAKLGRPASMTTISPSRIASSLVRGRISGYRCSMKVRRRFWNRWPYLTKAIARVPSHFSSKTCSSESNGISRDSASMGLMRSR